MGHEQDWRERLTKMAKTGRAVFKARTISEEPLPTIQLKEMVDDLPQLIQEAKSE